MLVWYDIIFTSFIYDYTVTVMIICYKFINLVSNLRKLIAQFVNRLLIAVRIIRNRIRLYSLSFVMQENKK